MQDLAKGDEVLIRVHPERFPFRTLKKLHTQHMGPYKVLMRFGPSAYDRPVNGSGLDPDLTQLGGYEKGFSEPIPVYPFSKWVMSDFT